MQIKADSKIGEIGLNNLPLNNVRLTDFSEIQKQCHQCLQPIMDGDCVFVIFKSEKKLELDEINLTEPYIIHALPKEGRYCLEDFVSRLNPALGENPA